jgi:hypothetical protein
MTDEEAIRDLAGTMLSAPTGGESESELNDYFDGFLLGATVTAKIADRSSLAELIDYQLDLKMQKDEPTYREWIKHLNQFASPEYRWDIHKNRMVGPYSTHPPGGRSKTGLP